MLDSDRHGAYLDVAREYKVSYVKAMLTVDNPRLFPDSRLAFEGFPEPVRGRLTNFGKLIDQLNRPKWAQIELRSQESIPPYNQQWKDAVLSAEIEDDRFKPLGAAFSEAARISYVNSWVGVTDSNIEAYGTGRRVDLMAEAAKYAAYEIVLRGSLTEKGGASFAFPYSEKFLSSNEESRALVGVDLPETNLIVISERRAQRWKDVATIARGAAAWAAFSLPGTYLVGERAGIGDPNLISVTGAVMAGCGLFFLLTAIREAMREK